LERPDPLVTDQLRVLAVTWNIAGKTPEEREIKNLIHPDQIHHDIYAVGSQEALNSITGSIFSPCKKKMNQMIQNCLGNDYAMVSSVSLQATHLVVFINVRLCPLVQKIETDTIATGWQNMMGNKGAVKVSFNLAGQKFVFINSHLHSG